MTDPTKPTPLPHPDIQYWDEDAQSDFLAYSEDQMTAHELAGYRRGIEAAARAANKQARFTGYNAHAVAITDAIRELKEQA